MKRISLSLSLSLSLLQMHPELLLAIQSAEAAISAARATAAIDSGRESHPRGSLEWHRSADETAPGSNPSAAVDSAQRILQGEARSAARKRPPAGGSDRAMLLDNDTEAGPHV